MSQQYYRLLNHGEMTCLGDEEWVDLGDRGRDAGWTPADLGIIVDRLNAPVRRPLDYEELLPTGGIFGSSRRRGLTTGKATRGPATKRKTTMSEKTIITRSKGGDLERKVAMSAVKIPDLWHQAVWLNDLWHQRED
jgi:hypothetical protein